MSDANEFNFDNLTPKSVPVAFRNRKYLLREASEDAAVRYRDCFVTKARMDDGKVTGVGAVSVAEPQLVADCLFEVLPNGDTKRNQNGVEIPELLSEVRHWPVRIVKPLFKWVKDNSDLTEVPETPEEIEQQIAKLQSLLSKLRKGDSSPKDVSESGPIT